MKQNIDAIRGDLNQFKKLVNAVEFAVESFEGVAARESRKRELDNLLKSGNEELTGLKDKTAAARAALKKVSDDLDGKRQGAEQEAGKIISDAKEEAKKLLKKAQDGVDALAQQKESLEGDLTKLNGDIGTLQKDKKKAQTELDAITDSMESALSRVKK